MKTHTVKRWGLRLFLLLILIGGLTLLWVNHQLKKIQGSFTEVIDTSNLYNPYSELVIKNVQILSPDCTHFIPNQRVILKDGIISAIQADSIQVSHLPVIEGNGKYLVPGLVDSHVHLRNSKNDLYLYLANGITGIREMSGNLTHLNWKKEIQAGALGPQMFVASEKVHSKEGLAGLFDSWTRGRINYTNEEEAAKKIKQIHEAGFDAIKISSFINKEMYDATLRIAKPYEIPVIGHIPFSVGLYEVYHSRQSEIAHIEEIVKSMIWGYGGYDAHTAEPFLNFLLSKSDSIAISLREKDIAVTSTLWLMESIPHQKLNLDSIISEVPLEYANPALVEGTILAPGWLPGTNYYEEPEDVITDRNKRAFSQMYWDTYVKAIHVMTRMLAKNKVLLMAGTDANTALTIPGFSLHDELESLTKSGLSNSQALFSATVAPGIWTQSNTGKIQEGFQADLVLLSQNPLENIRNTRSVEAVFSGKNWMDQDQLTQILSAVLEANEQNRSFDLNEFSK